MDPEREDYDDQFGRPDTPTRPSPLGFFLGFAVGVPLAILALLSAALALADLR